jgi:hypothetical protein
VKLRTSGSPQVHKIPVGQDLETLAENYLRKLKILPFQLQYIFSLLLFVANNKDPIQAKF